MSGNQNDAMPRQPQTTARWVFVASVVASLALRALYLAHAERIDLSEHPVFIADEGVVGLMARHILAGARPVFYYGQYYMGALEAYLAAALFPLLGESLTVVRLVPTLFALSWIPLTYAIGRRLYDRRSGLLAAALVALPSQFVFEWGFKARGGFAEHVALMLLLLYLLLLLLEEVTSARVVVFGLAAGLSLWVNQLALAYVPICAAVLLFWVRLDVRRWIVMAAAGLVGMAPLVYGNIVLPLATARALTAEVRSVLRSTAGASAGTKAKKKREYRAVELFRVLGAQRDRDGSWSAIGSLGALFLVLGAAASVPAALATRRPDPARFRCHLVLFAFVAMSIVVGAGAFAGQPVGRYQLLLYPLLSILAVGGLRRFSWAVAVGAVAVLALGQGAALAMPPRPEARAPRSAVIDALLEHGLERGYSAGFMQDLVFDSAERVILVPIERSRYRPYEDAVANASRVFYIYRDDQRNKPAHRELLHMIAEKGLQYEQFEVGEYTVLYDFEPPGRLGRDALRQLRQRVRQRKGKAS